MQESTNGPPGEATQNSVDARIGTLIADRYLVERLIGRGGMASVFEASDTVLPRRVALKVFRPEIADQDDMRRHDGEVGMLAALNHPGLVTLHDAVADERGAAVLVLELVDGTDLREAMDARTLSHRDVGLIGAIVADALAYSHARGIIHRDVKPANILVPLSDDGYTGSRAKLADFGIARLVDETRVTAIGSIIGTAQYLSPEQALGGEVGPPSDVYSLGLVLIEALGGERPFPGTGVESVAARIASDPAMPDGVNADWASLLSGMTAREPAQRLSAAEAGRALRALAESVPHAVATPPENDEPGESPVYAPTAIMPTSALPTSGDTAVTELLGRTPRAHDDVATVVSRAATPAVVTRATTAAVGPASPGQGARSRRVVVAIVGALLVAAGGIALGVAVTTSNLPATPTHQSPAYPDVDGTNGDHLEQLQRSVAP